MMMGTKEPESTPDEFVIWIDKANQILSLHPVEEFEKIVFQKHTDVLNYAYRLAESGYKVQ